MRTATFALALALVPAALASCGPRWTVVHQAMPDPFAGRPQFVVEPMRFDDVVIGDKSEPEYLAGKDPDQRASWQTDKAGMIERFTVGLAGADEGIVVSQLRPDLPHVRAHVTFIEPGFYAFVTKNTVVRAHIEVLSPQGAPLDEIVVESTVGASMTNPASGTRLRQAAEDLGGVTAKYLHTRVGGG